MTATTRRLVWATLIVWAAVAAKWIIYGLIAQATMATPPLFILIILLSVLIGAGIYICFAGIKKTVFGTGRLVGVALIFFALTPVIWSALFMADLRYRAVERESLEFNFPTRSVGYWAASIADIEALWTKRHRTNGKYLKLYTEEPLENAAKLVDEMDRHIEQMADELGCDPPAIPTRWVRGKLLGFDGRALLCWGICDTNESELTYLDRHEVAHVVITILAGPQQDPPMLLAEGWAQHNSAEMDTDLRSLAIELNHGTNYRLEELMAEDTYGASIRAAYSYGGPFTNWLINKFGGVQFFQIYSTVRRDSFRSDFQRVYKRPFDELESEFWKWIENHPAAGLEEEQKTEIELARNLDKTKWDELQALYRTNQPENSLAMPWGSAFELNSHFEPGDDREKWIFVFKESEEAWIQIETKFGLSYTVACDSYLMDASLDSNGFPSGDLLKPRKRREVLRRINGHIQYFVGWPDPRTYVVDPHDRKRFVQRVTPPSDASRHWEVVERITDDERSLLWENTYLVDPDKNYWITVFEQRLIGGGNKQLEPDLKSEIAERRTTKFDYVKAGGVTIPVLTEMETNFRGNKDDVRGQIKIRNLNAREQEELISSLDRIAAQLSIPKGPWWIRYQSFLSTLFPVVAIGCLLIGCLLMRDRTVDGDE